MAAWWDMKKSKNLVEQDVIVTVSKRTEILQDKNILTKWKPL
jgi:hypothetical protein